MTLYFDVKRSRRLGPPQARQSHRRLIRNKERVRTRAFSRPVEDNAIGRLTVSPILDSGLSYDDQLEFLTKDEVTQLKRIIYLVILQALDDLTDKALPLGRRTEAQFFMLFEAEELLSACGIVVRIDHDTLSTYAERKKAIRSNYGLGGNSAQWGATAPF